MDKLSIILEGWSTYFVGPDIEDLEEVMRRGKICASCEVSSYGKHLGILVDMQVKEVQGLYCDKKKGGCGCPITPAIRSKNKKCDLGKW